jgi:hypothetical protein
MQKILKRHNKKTLAWIKNFKLMEAATAVAGVYRIDTQPDI